MDKTEKRWHFRDQQARLSPISFLFRGFRKKLPACCLRVRKSREIDRFKMDKTDGIFVIYPPRKHGFFYSGASEKSFPLAAYACVRVEKSQSVKVRPLQNG